MNNKKEPKVDRKNYHKDHRERMRSRFFESGIASFRKHELIEMLLFYSIPVKNTNVTAHMVIDELEDIKGVFNADAERLKKINGLGDTSVWWLRFFSDLCRYYISETRSAPEVYSIDNTEEFVKEYFSGSSSNNYLIMDLDQNMNLLNINVIPNDNENFVMSVRNIAEIVLKANMCKIVIGHNLFNKPAVPSSSEYELMFRLAETLNTLEIELYDYIICGSGSSFSARKNGAFSFMKGENFGG